MVVLNRPGPLFYRPSGGGGMTGVVFDNIIYVNQATTDPKGDGSLARPFLTIQEALDLVVAKLDASITNSYGIEVAPGIYKEACVKRSPYTHLFGTAPNAVIIEAPNGAGPALLTTDATLASIATFLAASGDDVITADAQYTTLAHDAGLAFPNSVSRPTGSTVSNLTLTAETVNKNGHYCCQYIVAENGGDTSTASLDEKHFFNIVFGESFYGRNGRNFRISHSKHFGAFDTRNLHLFFDFSVAVHRSHEFDVAQPRPGAPFDTFCAVVAQSIACGHVDSIGAGLLTTERQSYLSSYTSALQGASVSTYEVNIKNVDLQDDSSFTAFGGTVREDIDLTNPGAVGVSLSLEGAHVQGDINLAAGGNKTATMDGGDLIGALTDPDNVFVRSIETAADALVWKTALELDFAAEANQDLTGLSTVVIQGQTWDVINPANADLFELLLGTGLRIDAKDDKDMAPGAGRIDAPYLALALTSLIPNYNRYMALEISIEYNVVNLNENNNSLFFGMLEIASINKTFIGIRPAVTEGVIFYSTPKETSGLAGSGVAPSGDVLMVEKLKGWSQVLYWEGTYSGGWPTNVRIDQGSASIIGTSDSYIKPTDELPAKADLKIALGCSDWSTASSDAIAEIKKIRVRYQDL